MNEIAFIPKYKVLGSNDDENFCQLCNKQELQKVVWLEDTDTGEIIHAGVICASKLMRISSDEVKEQLKEAEYAKLMEAINQKIAGYYTLKHEKQTAFEAGNNQRANEIRRKLWWYQRRFEKFYCFTFQKFLAPISARQAKNILKDLS